MAASTELSEQDVLDAVETMVNAFGASDTEAYFDCFDESATFIFYYEPQRLNSRKEYQTVWQSWLDQGITVTSCQSTNQRVQLAGTSALFLHDVETTVDEDGTVETRWERETITFARFDDGSVRAIHEHLSARPERVE
ncbi:YybH family protein [Rhodococcus sp. NPDC057529]|uniref:YybH family protein n=1 Tax=Rhodococcus sp. NPDC057529 TaxID=3346158 RepID=UPI00366D0CCD